MRLNGSPSWDLAASALISVFTLILVQLSPPSIRGFSIILGFLLTIPLPGYCFVLSIFPAKSDLGSRRRALLSLGVSAFLAALMSLVLVAIGSPLTYVATILPLLCLFLTAVAYVRWSALPRGRRFILMPLRGRRSRRSLGISLLVDVRDWVVPLLNPLFSWRGALLSLDAETFLAAFAYVRRSAMPGRRRFVTQSKKVHKSGRYLGSPPFGGIKGQVVSLLFLIVVISALAMSAFTNGTNQGQSSEKGFTEFHIFWPKDLVKTETASLAIESKVTAVAEIINRENGAVNYTLRLDFNNSSLFSKDLRLGQNENWQYPVSWVVDGPPGRQRLDFLLFKEGDSASPYREDHLWINSYDIKSNNSSQINVSLESPPLTVEQKSKVVVMEVNNVSSGGNSTSSGEKSSIQESSDKISIQGLSSEESNQQRSSGPSSDETSGIASVESLKENQTTNPGSLQKNGSNEEMALSNSPLSASSDDKTLSPETNNLGNTTNRTEKNAIKINISNENKTDISIENPNSNLPPSLADLSPNMPYPQIAGMTIIWTANATDPDGDVIFYKFLLDDKAITDWSASNSWTWNTSSFAPGDYRIKVLIRDGKHSSEDAFDSSTEATFTLTKPNQLPVFEDLRPDLDSPQTSGKSVVWTANATDPDGDIIFYKFLLDDKAIVDWSTSNSWIWNTSSFAPGDYRIKVLIRDGKHASLDAFDSFKEATFALIRPNQLPVLENLRPDLDSPQASGKSIVWTANATDPDGDLVLYKFLINDRPATVWSRFNTFNWVTTKTAPGDYRIKALIRDDKHASEDAFDSSKETTFTLIQPNQRPVLENLRPDLDNPQVSGKSIVWTANAADPDGDVIFYKFLLDDKAITDWSASDSWTWNTSSFAPGDYRIKALIRDGKHASENSFDSSKETTFTLIQPNQRPVLENLRPDLGSPQTSGKSVVWTANATDPDGDIIFYKFLLDNKAITDWSTSNSWSWNTSSLTTGDYRIKVLIRDGKHASENSFDGSNEATFTLTKPNQLPVFENLRPDLGSPQTSGKSVVWTANATDPDGDIIFYKFLLDNKAITDWSTSNSWSWNTSSLTTGDYRIKVLIRDGKHASENSFDGSNEATFTLTKPNQLPVFENLRPDLGSPQTSGKSVVWTANATDPDGDVIFYKFLLDDKAITDWSVSNSWTWNTSSLTTGDYRIKVLIRDGKHASENSFDGSNEATFTLTKPNQLPVFENLRPDLGSPQTSGKSVVWTANATDPDGDVIFYKFLLDDKAITDWSVSNSWTWNTSSLATGDYRIKTLIRDGKHTSENSFDGSNEATFTLNQPNQRPVFENLRPDLGSPQASGKVIAWTANAVDPDGDVIFYKFLLDDKAMTEWSASNSWTWNTSSLTPGDYRIKTLIRDGKHASLYAFDGSTEAPFNLTKPNQRPVFENLRPDLDSPQTSGKTIVWMANAADPDGDVIFYKFLLDDKAMTEWSASNLWTWYTYSVAPGDYRIKVLIRDGEHASEDAFDGFKETNFTLLRSSRSPALKSPKPVVDSAQASRKASSGWQMLPTKM